MPSAFETEYAVSARISGRMVAATRAITSFELANAGAPGSFIQAPFPSSRAMIVIKHHAHS